MGPLLEILIAGMGGRKSEMLMGPCRIAAPQAGLPL